MTVALCKYLLLVPMWFHLNSIVVRIYNTFSIRRTGLEPGTPKLVRPPVLVQHQHQSEVPVRRRGEGVHQGPQRASHGLHGRVARLQLRGAGVVLDRRVRDMCGRRGSNRLPAVASDRLDVMAEKICVARSK